MKSNTEDNTLTQEIAAALAYRLFFEHALEWKDYYIYFEPRQDKQSELLKSMGKTMNYTDLPEFINTHAEQSTPVDFYFVCKDEDPAIVYPVQAKIFGINQDPENITSIFCNYIDKLCKKYAKTETTLLVQLRNRGTVDLVKVIEHLEGKECPFREIVIFTQNESAAVTMCQVLPNDGEAQCLSFTRDELLAG